MQENMYEGMTNFEIAQLVVAHRAAIADDIALYISILFGFLLVLHFVSKQLNRLQLIGLCFVYSAFVFLLIFGTMGTVQEVRLALMKLSGIDPIVGFAVPIVMFMSWVLSMIYCVGLRKKDA